MSRKTRCGRIARTGRLAILFSSLALEANSASGQQPFTEEALTRGINYLVPAGAGFGRGLAFADLDDDGDPDVVLLGRGDGRIGLYENDGAGFFADRSNQLGLPLSPAASGVIAGDYDRDGDLDLYISGYGSPNQLLRNEGNFSFTPAGVLAGVADSGAGEGCAWADYDGDGWLDLYVANRTDPFFPQPNRLYRNLGDGTFAEVAAALGVDRGIDLTFQAAFFDYDRDGDPDLYLATDKGLNCAIMRNHLYENQNGLFVEVTDLSGAEACIEAMCIAIGDFDHNGWPDLYSTNTTSGNALMMNQGNGTFLRQEEAAGVASHSVGWGSLFFDYDNDGILDLYVCNMGDPNRLYHNPDAWPCVDISQSVGLNTIGPSFANAAGDVDGDGDLDLLLMNQGEHIRLFINHEGELRSWAKFDVIGSGPSRYAIGANLDISTGTHHQLREVIAGENFKSQNELVQHVGLGTSSVMDEIQISWPGGATRTLTNYAVNHAWKIYPPDKLGDYNGNGAINIDDLIFLLRRYTGPFSPTPGTPGPLIPGAGRERMDFDGDADIDMADLIALLNRFDS